MLYLNYFYNYFEMLTIFNFSMHYLDISTQLKSRGSRKGSFFGAIKTHMLVVTKLLHISQYFYYQIQFIIIIFNNKIIKHTRF